MVQNHGDLVMSTFKTEDDGSESSIDSLLQQGASVTETFDIAEPDEPWVRRDLHMPEKRRQKQKYPNKYGNLNVELLRKLRMLTSIDDIRSLRFWKAVVAEFIGTLLLVLVGCGSCIQGWETSTKSFSTLGKVNVSGTIQDAGDYLDVVQIALAFGLSVATVVWIIGHISGGHINPAVTCAMFITRRVSLARCVIFILSQLIGAVIGAGILKGVTPPSLQGPLGATMLGRDMDGGRGVGVEFCITFVLVLTVFASCDKRRKDLSGSFPLTIGLSVTMCHLFAIQFTGASMNTARSFGPAVVMGIWDGHWVYWVGPILGGVCAGLVYDNVLASNASLTKARAFLLASEYDDNNFHAKKQKIKILEEVDEDNDGNESQPTNAERKEMA